MWKSRRRMAGFHGMHHGTIPAHRVVEDQRRMRRLSLIGTRTITKPGFATIVSCMLRFCGRHTGISQLRGCDSDDQRVRHVLPVAAELGLGSALPSNSLAYMRHVHRTHRPLRCCHGESRTIQQDAEGEDEAQHGRPEGHRHYCTRTS